MKFKSIILLSIVVIAIFGFTAISHAGILDTVTNAIKDNIVSGIVSLLFITIAGIFGKKYMKFKKPVIEIIDVYEKFKNAQDKNSLGGKKITQKEWEDIFKEMGEAVTAIIEVLPAKWLAKTRR